MKASANGVTPFARLAQSGRIGKPPRRFSMTDAPRITVEDLKKRMDAGEDFTVIDVRNPRAWAESDTMLPEAIRVPLDKLEENLPRIPENKPVVAYCT